MWPPTPTPGRCARCTMIAAFQRIQARIAALDVLVAGEPRLALGRDRVDVVGAAQRRDADALLAGALAAAQHQVARAVRAGVRHERRRRTRATRRSRPGRCRRTGWAALRRAGARGRVRVPRGLSISSGRTGRHGRRVTSGPRRSDGLCTPDRGVAGLHPAGYRPVTSDGVRGVLPGIRTRRAHPSRPVMLASCPAGPVDYAQPLGVASPDSPARERRRRTS